MEWSYKDNEIYTYKKHDLKQQNLIIMCMQGLVSHCRATCLISSAEVAVLELLHCIVSQLSQLSMSLLSVTAVSSAIRIMHPHLHSFQRELSPTTEEAVLLSFVEIKR